MKTSENEELKQELLQKLQRLIPTTKRAVFEYQSTLLASFGLSHAQLECLLAIHNTIGKEATTTKDLATKLNVTPGAISIVTDFLYSQGLITRKEDKNDRRVIRLELTAQGKKIINKILSDKKSLFYEAFKKLSKEELKTLIYLQEKIINSIKHGSSKASEDQ